MTLAGLTLRRATLDDVAAIEALIAESAHGLGALDYSRAQIEAALRGAFGVDTQLLKDGSYFVAEVGGELAACGGWSFRRTLFGSDARADRDSQTLDPKTDAAKIRAFFVRPKYARQGIGTVLLERCEAEARAKGFHRFELMATLPGVRLYEARGYRPGELIRWPLPGGLAIEFVPMSK
jgi:GNAT superfamily N-acetyltransferase